MGVNCGSKLRLGPPVYDNSHSSKVLEEQEEQFFVGYNRRVGLCDVRQLQARATISLASKAFEEKMKSIIRREPLLASSSKSPLYSVTNGNYTGLSMKRSLQRFLQKRRSRIQSSSPYNNLYSK